MMHKRPSVLVIFLVVVQILFVFYNPSQSLPAPNKSPNIVLFLTDDQDSELGGLTPLSKSKSWISDKGVKFDNSFVTVPVCCPSRSSILTGLYQPHSKVVNNSLEGNCWGTEWRENGEQKTFATSLKANGYTTFYAGKYLNTYCRSLDNERKQDYAVPAGWDHWAGLCGNSKYYNYTLSIDGVAEEHGDNYENDYLTDVIGRKAESWLNSYENQQNEDKKPFLMVLSTPAPHGPFTPAPQYANEFANEKAPRTPAFNYAEEGNSRKHWVMRQQPLPLTQDLIDEVDDVFRNRWRTLLSVDDMVDKVMTKIESMGELDNTFFILTSDHGYHLGTFGLMWDKRMMYDTDLRVPLLVRGPGVMSNKTITDVNVNIDLAPTIIDMSGQDVAPHAFDGISFLPFIQEKSDSKSDMAIVRDSFLFSYNGEYNVELNLDTCSDHIKGDSNMAHCKVEWDCKCEDTKNNTYVGKRTINAQENQVFTMFEDDDKMIETYNLNDDPYQLYNLQLDDLKKDPKQKQWIESTIEELKKFKAETSN